MHPTPTAASHDAVRRSTLRSPDGGHEERGPRCDDDRRRARGDEERQHRGRREHAEVGRCARSPRAFGEHQDRAGREEVEGVLLQPRGVLDDHGADRDDRRARDGDPPFGAEPSKEAVDRGDRGDAEDKRGQLGEPRGRRVEANPLRSASPNPGAVSTMWTAFERPTLAGAAAQASSNHRSREVKPCALMTAPNDGHANQHREVEANVPPGSRGLRRRRRHRPRRVGCHW